MSQESPQTELPGNANPHGLGGMLKASNESPHLTLADLMLANVGLAVVLASPIRLGFAGALPVGTQIPAWVIILIWVIWFGVAMLHGVAVAIFVRCVRYQRMPMWNEWLVFLFCAYVCESAIPNVDTTLAAFWRATGIHSEGFTLWRLGIGFLAALGTLVGWIGGKRTSLPIAVRIILYTLAALLWFWGPCAVLPMLKSDVASVFQTQILLLSHTWHSLLRLVFGSAAFVPFLLAICWARKEPRPQQFTRLLWSERCGLLIGLFAILGAAFTIVMEVVGVIQQLV